jgi:pyridoxamine 5'-phosphate oxidase
MNPVRPPCKPGFRLIPPHMEFWAGHAFRLHDRVLFSHTSQEAAWLRTRLYP